MADSEGCERNPFAQDGFKPKVAYLQNLSEIEKIVCAYRFGPLRHALLIFIQPAPSTLQQFQILNFQGIDLCEPRI